jgi:hypothetical protein
VRQRFSRLEATRRTLHGKPGTGRASINAYFEETQLRSIREGDAATILLMGYRQVVHGPAERSAGWGVSLAVKA